MQRALNDEKVLNVNEIRVWTPRSRFIDIIKGEFRYLHCEAMNCVNEAR